MIYEFSKIYSSEVPLTESHTAYMYTGQQREQTAGGELYYYGARYYDPALGRFISPDPLVGEFNFAGAVKPDGDGKQETSAGRIDPWGYVVQNGANWYAYCENNPLRYVDPVQGRCQPILPPNTITCVHPPQLWRDYPVK